jgi:hypothetical protein
LRVRTRFCLGEQLCELLKSSVLYQGTTFSRAETIEKTTGFSPGVNKHHPSRFTWV